MTDNPFYFGRMVSGEAFTDRKKETARLRANFRNGINTILISPRRWGKSSLVKKAGELARTRDKNIRVVYLDVFSLRTEQEFYTAYTKAILEATSSRWEERLKNLKDFFKQITPKFLALSRIQTGILIMFNNYRTLFGKKQIGVLPMKYTQQPLMIC